MRPVSEYSLTACAGQARGCRIQVIVQSVVCSDCQMLLPRDLMGRLLLTKHSARRAEKLAIRAAVRTLLAVPR